MALVRCVVLISLALGVAACGSPNDANPWDVKRLELETTPGFFSSPAVPLARGDFRLLGNADGDVTTGLIAWTNGDPPFIRTNRGPAFLQQGGGPGEARRVKSVSVMDSLLLAVTSRRLSWFAPDGRFINSVSADFRVDYAAPGCRGGTWVLYGEGTELHGDSVAWLHELDPETREIRPILFGPPSPFAFQPRDVSLRKIGTRLRYDHMHGAAPGLYEYDCASGEAARIGPTPLAPTYFKLDHDPVPRSPRRFVQASLSGRSVGGIRRLDLPEPIYFGSRIHIISVDSMYMTGELLRHGANGWETMALPTYPKLIGQVADQSVAVVSPDDDPVLYLLPMKTFVDGLERIWAGGAS